MSQKIPLLARNSKGDSWRDQETNCKKPRHLYWSLACNWWNEIEDWLWLFTFSAGLYCRHGGTFPLKFNEEASEAIVCMLVGLRGHWKLPIAYILVNCTSGDLIKALIKRCLEETHKVGMKIRSCVMDGTAHNLAGLDKMGASTQKLETLQPLFKHPSDSGLEVLAYPDPPHTMKLSKHTLIILKKGIPWNKCSLLWICSSTQNVRCHNLIQLTYLMGSQLGC